MNLVPDVEQDKAENVNPEHAQYDGPEDINRLIFQSTHQKICRVKVGRGEYDEHSQAEKQEQMVGLYAENIV